MADRTQQAYGLSSPTIDIKRPTRVLNRAPTTKDRGAPGDLILNSATGDLWVLQNISAGDYNWTKTTGEDGDVVGPASSTDNAITVFDGTSGTQVKTAPVSMPEADGSNGQVLQTDGAGSLDWATISGGGIEGTHYIYVAGNGTDTENATELQNAYDTAKADTPGASNVWTIVVGPGEYNFASDFEADADYINVVSLTASRDVVFNGDGAINVTADNATFRGLDMQDNAFTIATGLDGLRCENCAGGDQSFGYTDDQSAMVVSGTFISCTGGDDSFAVSSSEVAEAGAVTISGTMIDCEANTLSFAVSTRENAEISGTLIRCKSNPSGSGESSSFGFSLFETATISGTLIECDSGDNSFGGENSGASVPSSQSILSGRFVNCVGGEHSFGGRNTGTGILSGDFWNCKADANSFGDGETITGRLVGCILTSGSFGDVGESDGVIAGCIDGSQNIVNEDQSA